MNTTRRRFFTIAAAALGFLLLTGQSSIPAGFSELKIISGVKTVAAAATPEALVASNTYVVSVFIYPASATQGTAYVGARGNENFPIPFAVPGYGTGNSVINLKNLYIKVATNSDSVRWIALYR